ncbi:hypothetical protein QR680_010484 [Steinernema hermaphroditum]|uniref:Uncharacterized protein n=1 Tax=Steinernema hermaphroditum TaxID=289476 RepID=A0AA39MBN5_9BILA|nr:hypothetical protein QR680_010484 [Steinernema hermaphroditum]
MPVNAHPRNRLVRLNNAILAVQHRRKDAHVEESPLPTHLDGRTDSSADLSSMVAHQPDFLAKIDEAKSAMRAISSANRRFRKTCSRAAVKSFGLMFNTVDGLLKVHDDDEQRQTVINRREVLPEARLFHWLRRIEYPFNPLVDRFSCAAESQSLKIFVSRGTSRCCSTSHRLQGFFNFAYQQIRTFFLRLMFFIPYFNYRVALSSNINCRWRHGVFQNHLNFWIPSYRLLHKPLVVFHKILLDFTMVQLVEFGDVGRIAASSLRTVVASSLLFLGRILRQSGLLQTDFRSLLCGTVQDPRHLRSSCRIASRPGVWMTAHQELLFLSIEVPSSRRGHDKLRESAGTKEVNDPKQPEPGPQDHKDDRKDQESSEEKVLKRKEVEESDVPAAASHSEKEESTEQSDVDVKRTSTSSQEAVPEDELVAKDGDLTAHVGAIETIPDDVVDIKAKELKTEQNRTPLSTKEQHAPAPQEETQIEDYVYDAKAPLECLSSTDIADYDNPAKEDVPDPGAFSFFSRELNLEPEKPDVAPSGSETLRDSKKRQSTDFAPSVRQLFSAFRVAPEQKVEEASKEFNLISWNKSEHAGITKNIKEEEKVVSTVEISEGDRKKDEEDLVEEKFVDPYRPTLFKLDEAELERYDSEIGRTELAATKVNKAAIAKIAKDVEEDVCVKEEEHQKVSQNEKGDESC